LKIGFFELKVFTVLKIVAYNKQMDRHLEEYVGLFYGSLELHFWLTA